MHTCLKNQEENNLPTLSGTFIFAFKSQDQYVPHDVCPSACRFSKCCVLLSEVALQQVKHQQHEPTTVIAGPSFFFYQAEWPHAVLHLVFLANKWTCVILTIVLILYS